jgi:hypothetical protein
MGLSRTIDRHLARPDAVVNMMDAGSGGRGDLDRVKATPVTNDVSNKESSMLRKVMIFTIAAALLGGFAIPTAVLARGGGGHGGGGHGGGGHFGGGHFGGGHFGGAHFGGASHFARSSGHVVGTHVNRTRVASGDRGFHGRRRFGYYGGYWNGASCYPYPGTYPWCDWPN